MTILIIIAISLTAVASAAVVCVRYARQVDRELQAAISAVERALGALRVHNERIEAEHAFIRDRSGM